MKSPTGFIPWFSKTEGNTYATLLHHPFLFRGKPTHDQEVAGACEIASLIEKYDANLYKSNFFAILKYGYENYSHERMLPLEHCVGFPQRGRDDAAK